MQPVPVDPTVLHPMPEHPRVVLLKPLVTSPLIEVGDFTCCEQADAFVTHAGMGGCGEGLLAGVPMIAVPQGAEQFMNADRLVELGVARRVDTADANAETLRAALSDLVADPERADRSKRLQAAARAEGDPPRAADLVENMLAAAGDPALGPYRPGGLGGRQQFLRPPCRGGNQGG